MKRMKKLGFLFIALVFSVQVIGQEDEGKNYGATPEDSLICIQSLSLYSEFYKQDNYTDALKGWRKALEVCPSSSLNLYIRGTKMLDFFIEKYEKEGNTEKMNAMVDTLLWLYDLRIANFGEEGKVLGTKGVDMMKFKKDDPKAAYEVLYRSYELEGNDFSPAAIVYLFLAKYYMYAKKLATKEELLELYPKLADVVDYNIGNNEEYASTYEKAGQNLENYFSKVADCPDLIELFTPKFEGMKSDAKALKSLMKILDKRGCNDEDLYLNAAIALNEIEPDAVASYRIAKGKFKRENYSEAIEFFKKSIELRENNNENFDAYINMAKAYLISKDFPNTKLAASKALEINSNSGEALILIGDAYGYGGKSCSKNECDAKAGWWLAYDYYLRAKSDESVAEKAGKKLAQAKEQFPSKEDCFFYSLTDGDTYNFEGCWISGSTTIRTK